MLIVRHLMLVFIPSNFPAAPPFFELQSLQYMQKAKPKEVSDESQTAEMCV